MGIMVVIGRENAISIEDWGGRVVPWARVWQLVVVWL